jgi:NAD(P)H-hydrate repair Nnr-like enzyme with NAD(P)H-hydrate dehydratase domain
MDYPYWKRQTTESPLFPDLEWSKPEQRNLRGRLGIIGGNKLGFAGVAESYSTALNAGAGYVRVLLPDALKKTIPPSMTDVVFGASNPSGGLSQESYNEMRALGEWASALLLVGDAGRNSETAITYEKLVAEYPGTLVITRDAVDLLKNSTGALIERDNTVLVVSFAQLQKIFQAVYYPKILTFSMQLLQLVEAVHKFTTTYPSTIVVFHKDTLIIAKDGTVTTTKWENPMAIWRGTTAATIATYLLWNSSQPLEAATASVIQA